MRNIRRTILWTLLTQALVASLPAVAQTSPTDATPKPSTPPPATPAASGQASQDQPKTLEGVTVSGIRGSLEAARDVKKDSTQIVDAVVADDIGKLPDTNVAESLGRVAGVQLVRGMGEGSDILVRGLHQNVFLYNGREIYDSTGRGGVGLDQLGTSTYGLLTLVPSQFISQLQVTKLASADQIDGALGGIIDINTRMPLNADGDQNVVAVSGTYGGLSHRAGGSGLALLSAHSADNRWGAMIAASYSHTDVVQQGLDTFSGYTAFKDPTSASPTTVRYGDSDMRAQNINDDRDKTGISAILQWRPVNGVEITADTFYSHQQAERDRDWLSFNPTSGLSNAVYSNNNILVAGTSKTPVLSNTEVANIDSDVWSTALKGTFHVSDHLDGSAQVSFDKSTAEYQQFYMRLQPKTGVNSVVNFDLRNGDFGSFNISGVNMTDPSQLNMTILFDNDYRARTDAPEVRSDWNWSFDSDTWKTLDFGVRYTQISSAQDPLRADIRPTGGIPATELMDFLQVYSNNNFMNGQFAGLPRDYLASYRSAFTGCSAFTAFPVISQNPQCLNGADNSLAYAGTFNIDEDFYEGYTKLDWGTNVGDMPLSGNVGVRYVQRELDSRGNLLSGSGAPIPTDFRRTDRNWLPSAIARLDISDQWLLRGGVARVVAYPNTADLNNGVSLNNNAVFQNGVQISPGTGTGGAPNLDPFKATQYDLSLEYYYSEQGMLSAGLFYKDISTFIIQKQSAETYAGTDYLINREVNGDHAKVQGAEILAQVPFTFLPDPFSGFGMVAPYTYVDSQTPIKDVTGRSLTFPGLSKNNANLIFYYETGPFSARVAYNWRDKYFVSLSAANTGVYNDTYSDLAASINYNFTDRLSLQLEASNLLNSQQRTYDGSPEGLRTNVVYGRNYMATATWRF
ncbi:TonB-dependent receptor [Dyella sp. C11]|uniref:TonB-dependent receptor n=1 Tax=Dyella sp. C11 TaxID=2126991 RepID=UPI000D65A6CB|nr:TonB-dependent receptor [Dyella sp. C11]